MARMMRSWDWEGRSFIYQIVWRCIKKIKIVNNTEEISEEEKHTSFSYPTTGPTLILHLTPEFK